MMYSMVTQNGKEVCDYLEPQNEQHLFAKQLVTQILRGQKRIYLTLSESCLITFAREIGRCIQEQNSTFWPKGFEPNNSNDIVVNRQEAMKIFGICSTTLWLWQKNGNLKPIKIGRRVFFRLRDIQKLYNL